MHAHIFFNYCTVFIFLNIFNEKNIFLKIMENRPYKETSFKLS